MYKQQGFILLFDSGPPAVTGQSLFGRRPSLPSRQTPQKSCQEKNNKNIIA